MHPVEYYDSNLGGLLNLLYCIQEMPLLKYFIFSSTAAVYGNVDPNALITEDSPTRPLSAYGQSKLIGEQVLRDFCKKFDGVFQDRMVQCIALRYFNPVGAHPSGLIGEDPSKPPGSLMPILSRVAAGKQPFANVYGTDYPTRDGSGCRDFIHVMDIAEAHVQALMKLEETHDVVARDENFKIYNLGSESGYTVFEMIDTLQKVTGKQIPYKVRRF
jgi:UDP-glucose 4-epimerase